MMRKKTTDDAGDKASEHGRSLLKRFKARILPEMPDFYALLIEQSEVTAEGTAALHRLLQDGAATSGEAFRRPETAARDAQLVNMHEPEPGFDSI